MSRFYRCPICGATFERKPPGKLQRREHLKEAHSEFFRVALRFNQVRAVAWIVFFIYVGISFVPILLEELSAVWYFLGLVAIFALNFLVFLPYYQLKVRRFRRSWKGKDHQHGEGSVLQS